MVRKLKRFGKEKHQFRSYYCLECKQQKPCQLLSHEYCCSCYYHWERENAQEYANYQQVYQRKEWERQEHIQQLKLLWKYAGCQQCGSKEADAYELYENNRFYVEVLEDALACYKECGKHRRNSY